MAIKKKAAPKKSKPRKKAAAKRKTRTAKKKKPPIGDELKKIFLGIAVLVAICLTVAMIADIYLNKNRSVPEKKQTVKIVKKQTAPIKKEQPSIVRELSKSPAEEHKKKSKPEIEYEIFKDVDDVIEKKPPAKVVDKTPKIAIIIDDIGYDKKITKALMDLNSNITFSVLPFSPFGSSLSKALNKSGAQLMLHLPMEPVEYPKVNPGPGALLSGMSPDALLEQLKKSLNNVPNIVGVNNHMGSKLTSASSQMNQIFTILKKRDLFFIDSKTAPQSQCKASARLLRLKFGQRDVFLDNFQKVEYITGQFKELLRIARKNGSAIGIGHPYSTTLEVLQKQLPNLKKQAKLVRASDLTFIPEQ
ncbi:MAG: divergent polysaccharide deacetylase family protein [Desulfobacteraceae bacterium]|nr:divergent polysaccharide deacetylase family protein [Desulfobacteraceae bacterium]